MNSANLKQEFFEFINTLQLIWGDTSTGENNTTELISV